jgi:outer membrane protein assembly factor BamA
MYMPANEIILSGCKITRFVRYAVPIFFIVLCFLLNSGTVFAQTYRLTTIYTDTHSVNARPGIKELFKSKEECRLYVVTLPQQLREKGFLGVSVDSFSLGNDGAVMRLYVGENYRWGSLRVKKEDEPLLQAVGYREKFFMNQVVDNDKVRRLQEKLIAYLENNGYPFAEVRIDSLDMVNGVIKTALFINKGPLYKLDSIRIFGEANIRNAFLQRYLDISNGSMYRKQQLLQVDKKLRQLPYLVVQQPSDINYLGSGALLNVYLKSKKSSQINGLVGFLPSSESTGSQKLLITGDFNMSLKNSFGLGESIQLMFQQIQIQSPRLKLSYQQPFLFGSPFGVDVLFEGFKKDSSFLNIQYQLGATYAFGGNRNGKVFFQQFITSLDYIDTAAIKRIKRLPEQIDQITTSIGVDYEWWNTDYRFNPRSGFDVKVQGTAGLRRIRKNNTITSLKNPLSANGNYGNLYDSLTLNAYSFRLRGTIAKYFKTGRQTVLKTSMSGGWVQSPGLFRNELFQLGGFQLLRGFDDESFFASAYTVITAEYRVLTGQNSFLYAFFDGGWVRNQSRFANTANLLWGTGLGATVDTKAGIFNVAFAIGKREDLPLNLRQLKIHFGYLNFF